jgi:3-oxoadipate enol-lactonase
MEVKMPKVDVDGMEINYRLDDLTDPWLEPETVQTILMHHGSNRNLKFWTPWVAQLARKYRVVRHDAPGFGESPWPKKIKLSEMTLQFFADAAARLMDSLGLEQVHWVGAMSGGIIGCLFAVSYPERIKSLTLCNTPYRISAEYWEAINGGYKDPIECVEQLGAGGWRARIVGASLDMSKADQRIAEWTIDEIGRTPKDIAVAYLKACDPQRADLSEELQKIKCPTLLINGDRSICMPPEMMVFMYRRIPNAQMVVFPGLGGSVENIIPDRCAQAALDFISGVDSTC